MPSQHRPVKDFTVVISEHHPNEPQPWRIFMDDLFMVRLKITKKDARTQEPILIPGAGFRISGRSRRKTMWSRQPPIRAVSGSAFLYK
ncbi:MAG: hypothetical protein ACLTSZ_19920 [Lachnospiraceae bacterium]